jgi:hypothetical protein
MDVTIAYPDDYPTDTTTCPALTPDPTLPFLYEAMPGHGKSSQFQISIDVNHGADPAPGASCALELISAKVGLAKGQRKVSPGQRI